MNVLQEKFQDARLAMHDALIEREEEIDLLLISLVAGENPLFVGPPGTAKSHMTNCMARWLEVPQFSYLLTKYTDPSELFGPIDIPALTEREYKRVVKGLLPEAVFAFLDEIWKASSAVLNTLLGVIHEKVFRYCNQRIQCPLVQLVSASNEWPNPENFKELSAIFDRFLVRKEVREVRTREGQKRLMDPQSNFEPRFKDHLQLPELKQAQKDLEKVKWSPDALEVRDKILIELRKEGILPGDRRKMKSIRVCQASAWVAGGDTVEPEHLEVLSHILWAEPVEQPKKAAQVVARLANPTGLQINQYTQEVAQIMTESDLHNMESAIAAKNKLDEIESKMKKLNLKDVRVQKALKQLDVERNTVLDTVFKRGPR